MILLPNNVLAVSDGFNIDTTSMTIEKNGTGTIQIVAQNAIGDVTIKSNDTAIATVDNSFWKTGAIEAGDTTTALITVTGISIGTTKITLEIDGALFDKNATSVSGTKTVNVTVIEKTEEPSISYTVTYNANGGENTPLTQTKVQDEPLILRTSVPTRKGYEFTGWNTKADGSGQAYKAGAKYEQNNNIILYAQWKEIKNAEKNPETGDTMIYIVLLLTLGALIYSYWYMNKSQEN